MTSAAFRWTLSAVLLAAVPVIMCATLAGRPLPLPGRTAAALARLDPRRSRRKPRGAIAVLAGRVRPRRPVEDGPGPGLGARLVRGGQPRRPLTPTEMAGHLPAPRPESARASGLGIQPVPASAMSRSDAGVAPPVPGIAPERRTVPAPAAVRADPGPLLRPASSPPHLPLAREELPRPASRPRIGTGPEIGHPPRRTDLPVPVFAVEIPSRPLNSGLLEQESR